MNREFDVVVFGGSGYTGRYVVEELARSTTTGHLRWAVAGRNPDKLRESLEIVQNYLGKEVSVKDVAVIEADVGDPASIAAMCAKTKLILNCVGPYTLCGGKLIVSTCIECRTHCVDISAEIKYLDEIQSLFFETARQAGVYILEACGMGSLPSDYGLALLKKKFQGGLNSVEYYVHIGEGPQGRTTNLGTFMSGVYSVKDYLRSDYFDLLLQRQLFPTPVTRSHFTPKHSWLPLQYSRKMSCLCVQYKGPDVRNIKRSDMFRAHFLNDTLAAHVHGYFQIPSFRAALSYSFAALSFLLLALFSCGRSLLAKYPGFFSAGHFSRSGPTRQQVLEGSTTYTFYAEGWSNKDECEGFSRAKPDKKLKLTITGPEPAYLLTSMCMVQAGLTLLNEQDKIPLEGGVLTPGVAFENTNLCKRLERRGLHIKFEDLS